MPENFEVHPSLKNVFQLRDKSVAEGKHIDFATAESLAFSSLLEEGYGVRLTGQDV